MAAQKKPAQIVGVRTREGLTVQRDDATFVIYSEDFDTELHFADAPALIKALQLISA